MKALTVWQPWASLIVAGAKPYEFRSWHAPRAMVGQRLVIHAGARKIDREAASELHRVLAFRSSSPEIARAAAETCLHPAEAIPLLERAWVDGLEPLPLAAGLGTARLGVPRDGREIAEEFGVPRANDSDRDDQANWGWPLFEIELWPEPVPMRGAQGFWNWPSPEEFRGDPS